MRISDWSSDVCSSDLLLIGIRRRAIFRNDLVGPSMIALYPALLAAFMGALLASRRLYVMFLGGGQHQASNDARESMFQSGIPMILKHQWGFGADRGAAALGYPTPAGQITTSGTASGRERVGTSG